MLQVIKGDATTPRPSKGEGVIIAHIANSVGGWGAGFVLALSKLSKAPEMAYRELARDFDVVRNKNSNRIPLGIVQFVECKPDNCAGTYIVANMIAQNGLDRAATPDGCLVDYAALEKCLTEVCKRAAALGFNLHMPAGMGSGLAGGDKQRITQMIQNIQQSTNANVTLWEFEDKSAPSFVPSDDVSNLG